MKKYTKFLALMGFALVMSACQQDSIIPEAPALPGDEIIFGATGAFESGDKGTRTIYGDVYEDSYGKYIQVKWVKGSDRMDIACPQSATAGNIKIAEYKVMDESNSVVKDTFDLDEELDSIRIEDSSVAATLQRQGNAGLQWSTADTHHFFASYPSKAMVSEKLQGIISQEQINSLGMTLNGEANAKLRGYLPVNQTPSKLPTEQTERENGKKGWVIEPDMTYAYMVANKSVGTRGNVGLQFTSQMTALEFEIVASDIEQNPNNTETVNHEIKILGVTLSHAGKEQIAGHFEYDYENYDFSNVEIEGADAHTNVTQMFPEGLLVDSKTGFVDVTFFVFPGVTFNDGNNDAPEDKLVKDLELTVLYQIDGVPQNRTAKIRKQIEPKKKYFFADVQLPKIMAGSISASNWFNVLDDDILVSQVSIPVASNMFANKAYTSLSDYRLQQTSTLEALWEMGVRGFELCNQSATPINTSSKTVQTYSLDDQKMIASETEVGETSETEDGVTFSDAIDILYNKFKGTGEPLILVCTYASKDDGYNPYHYVCNLFNSLDNFCTRHNVDKSIFTQIKSSTVTKDIKNKIAIVIRPGDDERWMSETKVHYTETGSLSGTEKSITTDPNYMLGKVTIPTTKNSPYGLTSYMKNASKFYERKESGGIFGLGVTVTDVDQGQGKLYKNEWWNRVLMVSDWGISSWDSWHRRGGEFYKFSTTATNYDAIVDAGRTPVSKQKYEDGIVGLSPVELNGYYYDHDMSNGATAYIQDMTRVVKTSISNMSLTLNYKRGSSSQKTNATVAWNESLNEKKMAIDGLFKKSVATKGNSNSHDLYINVLSAYYVTDKFEYIDDNEGGLVSLFPCYDSKNFKKAGQGGDYLSAAKDLTTHTYNLLSAKQNITGETAKLNEGPWGLVMMDYIGDDNNADSRKLVNLIMLNNFRFPLAIGVPDDGETPVTPPGGGGVQGE